MKYEEFEIDKNLEVFIRIVYTHIARHPGITMSELMVALEHEQPGPGYMGFATGVLRKWGAIALVEGRNGPYRFVPVVEGGFVP